MAKFTIDGITYEGTPAELAEMVREFTTVAAESKEVPVVETLEIGDKVIVSGLSIYGADHDGQVGKFQGIDEDGDYSVRFPDDYVRLYKRYQLEKVTDGTTLTAKVDELDSRVTALEKGDKPAYKTEKRAAKVGERILITNAKVSKGSYDNGDVLTVRRETGLRGIEGAVLAEDVTIGIFHEEYEVIVEGTPPKPAPAQEIEHNGETYTLVSRKAQAGDVVVLTESDVPYITVGKAYETVERGARSDLGFYDNVGDDILVYHSDRRTEENVLVYEKKMPAMKVGDYVRVKDGADSRHGDIEAGTIVKVTDFGHYITHKVRVDLLDGSDYDRFNADDLELVDEKDVTFAKIGRKPNEFKKGDIVRYTKTNVGVNSLRIVTVHKDTDKGGLTQVDFYPHEHAICTEQSESLELIAPVESRVDNVA